MTAMGVDVAQGGDDQRLSPNDYGGWYDQLVKKARSGMPNPATLPLPSSTPGATCVRLLSTLAAASAAMRLAFLTDQR